MALIGEISAALEEYYEADAGDSNDAVNEAADSMAEILVKIASFIESDFPLPDRDAIYDRVNDDGEADSDESQPD